MARSSDAAFPLSLIRDKTFQLRQVRRVFVLSLFFIVQSTLVLGIFYHAFLGNVVQGNAPLFFASEDIGNLAQTIPDMSVVLGKWVVVMLVLNSAVTLSIAVYILRRLGNPILAIRRALNEIADGNLAVRLRVDDDKDFGELVVALNSALEQVNKKITEAKSYTSVAEALDEQPAPDDKAIREALIECHQVLSYFDHEVPAVNEPSVEPATQRHKRAG